MSGLDRFIAVLSLFDETSEPISVQDMALSLNQPASTVYRTVRELVKASFLEPATSARYRLGAAFAHFDLLARHADPVARCGGPLLQEVVAQARVPSVALLSRLANDMILCVAHEAAQTVEFEWSLFERGRPIPLMQGSASKVIMAQLPAQQRKKLLCTRPDDCDEPQNEAAYAAPNEIFATIRRQGYLVTRGEIDPNLAAIAVPVGAPGIGVTASLSLIVEASRLTEELERRLVLLLVSSGSLLTEQLSRLEGASETEPV